MRINIRLKPNSKKGPKVEEFDGLFIVYTRQPAIDGKANQDLIKILADYYDLPKSRIKMISGLTSRNKIVEIVNSAT